VAARKGAWKLVGVTYSFPGRPWGGSSRCVDLLFFVDAGAVHAAVGLPFCLLQRPWRSLRSFSLGACSGGSRGAPLQWLMVPLPSWRWTKRQPLRRCFAPPVGSSCASSPSDFVPGVVDAVRRRSSVLEEEVGWGLDCFLSFPRGPMCLF
jgi:hypothetical protein